MNAAGSSPLLFDWEAPHRRARAIALFIVASLLLHVLCFYIFQIVYPQTVVLLPPPARVSVITNTSEDGRALLRWIEAEDPALASTTQRPPDSKSRALPKVEHVASYMNRQPPLKALPTPVVDLRPPSALPPRPVPTPASPPAPAVGTVATMVAFSEEIERLGGPKIAQKKFASSTAEQPDSVRFRVAINWRGEVQFSFQLNSSGDAALDEQARAYVALARFPERSTSVDDDSLVWGVATVNWGNDIARPSTNAAPTPTP